MDEQPVDLRFLPPDQTPQRSRRRRLRIPEHPLFHLALLAATFVTTTLAGGLLYTDTGGLLRGSAFADGYPFSIPLLAILGSHEMGHYLMCRRYGIAATLPYFIPSPFLTLIGTFGALIRIKEPYRDKKTLVDIGAAGPLTGFVVALPFLFYGVSRAKPIAQLNEPGATLFNYPLIVRLAQTWTGSGHYTSAMVHENPTFMAAWFGFLVTALNLMPIGQLDGGHVLRAVVGQRRQPIISIAVVLLALATGFRGATWAVFAVIVTIFIGVRHPPLENENQPLGFGRVLVAAVCVIVFALCFSLVPIQIL
jgi:membrane-associated protease RseP (regulator of RpoE activity)